MRQLLAAVIVAVLCLALGCKHSLSSRKFDETRPEQSKGIVYSTPKLLLGVKITYLIRDSIKVEQGVLNSSNRGRAVTIDKPIVLESAIVPDSSNSFIISDKALAASGLLETNVGMNYDSLGNLNSISYTANDKSAAVVSSILSSTVKLAGSVAAGLPMSVMSGNNFDRPVATNKEMGSKWEAKDKRLSALLNHQDDLYNALAKCLASEAGAKDAKRIRDEIKSNQETIDLWVKKNTYQVTTSEFVQEVWIDPCQASYSKETHSLRWDIPGPAVTVDTGSTIPTVTLEIDTLDECCSSTRFKIPETFFTAKDAIVDDGIVYRIPTFLRVSLLVDNFSVLGVQMPFPQFGRFAVAPFGSKRFGDQKTSLQFSRNGFISQFSLAGSAMDTSFQSISKVIDSLKTQILDIRFGSKATALADQTDLIKKQIALDSALTELKALRAKAADTTK